jgi:hypothetical protein
MTEVTRKVHVSVLSVDMTERKNKIKSMSSEFFQEEKNVYGSARDSASVDIFYIRIKY